MASKKVHAVLSAGCVVVQAGAPMFAFAQSAGSNLDLGSQDKSMTAGANVQSVTINVDGGSSQKTFSSGDLLTPAEFVALTQVLSGGAAAQTLNVASNGAALGGTFNLSTFAANAASIHIPQGVIGVSDAAMGAINLSGNLSNSGTLYAISSNSNITSAVFSANNIFNNQGALFSSVLPSTGLSGYTSVVTNLNLSLTAINDIINAGMISSAGALNLSAGGTIINALPAGAVGAQPILQALGNVNMISAQLQNAGLVTSLAANINVNSHIAQSILVNNVGGTLSALNGALNVRDASFDTGKFDLDIIGGDVLAKELNLFSGNGKINIAVNELQGKINVVSHELAIAANTPTIRMGTVIVTGDPIITNTNGDVIIEPDSGEAFLTNGGPLIVTASRHIISTAGIIDTNGGQIIMDAGGIINLTSTSLLNSKTASGLGGHISLSAVGGIFLNEEGTVSSGGYIKMNTPGSINAGNLVTGGNHGVVLTAGGTIATGNITTTSNIGGSVQIRAQQSGGAAPFIVGVGEDRNANGVNGSINVSGVSRAGFIYLNNGGAGDIVLAPSFLTLTGTGRAGDLAIDAGDGNIIFNAGTLNMAGSTGFKSGNLFLIANEIHLDNTSIELRGTNGGTFASSSSSIVGTGDSAINSIGTSGGGLIQLMSDDSLFATATFNSSTGVQALSVNGDVNYDTGLAINTSGSLQLNSNGAFSGGTVRLMGGDVVLQNGTIQIDASASSQGGGGSVEFDTATFANSATTSIVSNGAGFGGGGAITLSTFAGSSDLSIGDNFSLSANGGANGDGGYIYLNLTGTVNVSGEALSSSAGTDGLYGGSVEIYAGTSGSGDLNVNSTIDVSGGTGGGGSILLSSQNGAVSLSQTSALRAGSDSGFGGAVYVSAGTNLIADGSISASTTDGPAGLVNLASGTAGPGALSINGSIEADSSGAGAGGQVLLSYNSASQLTISGTVQANATDGQAGQITVRHSGGGNLNVLLNGTLSASANDSNGKISFNQEGRDVSLQGAGSIHGEFTASGSSVTVAMTGDGRSLSVGNVSSSTGNVSLHQSGSGSSLVVEEGRTIAAGGGNISLGAENITLENNTSLTMDSAGLLSIDSGSVSGNLTLTLPEAGTASIVMTASGGDLRPGTVSISPRNGGNLTITGNGSLAVSGATISASTSSGALTIDSGAFVSSDSFDELLGIGVELISGSGNINLLGSVETSNLSLATLQGGSIILGTDISSPTVSISTTGSGSITQTAGSIGIGSLVLASEAGTIGTAQSALNTNVLELKVTSGSDVFLSNDSDIDLKTSNVAGLLQLNNNGDISMESSVQADALALTSSGSISVFQSASGSSSVALSAGSAAITVSSTGSVSSTGDITLTTVHLQNDGEITSGGSVVVAAAGALVLNGTGSVTSSSEGVHISASSIDVQSSINLSAGSGTVAMQAGSISLGTTEEITLTVTGNSTLALSTAALTFANGSGIDVSKQSGTAISVNSNGALSVHLTASSGALLTTGGGAISFQSGIGGNMVFDNGSQLFATNLNVTGGSLTTTTTSADTSFNSVNVVSDNNVFVNVHNGTVALNGDITSSNTEGVIALLDPNGLVVGGNGNLEFVGGGYGSIIVAATGAGNDLVFTGNHIFNSGAGGSISFASDSQIAFGSNSNLSLAGGQTSITAGTITFGSNSSLTSASTISLSGNGLNIVTPGGGQATITAAGGVTVSSATGTQLTFATSTPGTNGTLAFSGGPVAIHSNGANVVVQPNTVLSSDNDIVITTPGGTLINNGLIQTPNQEDTITVEASGNLLVNQNLSATNIILRTIANNGNITLASNLHAIERLSVSAHGSGNILQTGGSIEANELVLESGSGNIGSKNNEITFSANHVRVSTSGSAWLQSSGSTGIESAQVGGSLTVTAGGNLTVAASTSSPTITANKVELSSVGNMILNGGVSANSVTLKAQAGSISGAGSVQGADVKLTAHDGDIGSALNPLNVAAGELTVHTTKSGSAFIREADAVSIDKVQVVGGFSLTSGGNLTVNDVKAKNGSISLVSNGSVQLVKNSKVTTDEGNILIQSKDTVNGTIRIGENSKIEALASAAPLGNVTIVVGEQPASWSAGTAPSNVSVSLKWGGHVYFGSKGFTATGKKNEINAWGSNVYFSVGSRPSSAIVLEGGVKITADPPPALPAPAASVGSKTPVAVPATFSATVSVPRGTSPVVTSPVYRPGYPLAGGVSLTPTGAESDIEPSALTPVAGYSKVIQATPMDKQVAFLRNADIRQSATTRTSVCDNGDLILEEGQLIVQARKSLNIIAGNDSVKLAQGAVALINRSGGTVEVFNLYESKSGCVQVFLKGQQPTTVGAGHSLCIGDITVASSVASRKHTSAVMKDGRTLHSAEYSMLSLANRAEVVSSLLQSPERTSRQLVERLLKMAAALNVVTQSHGPFGK